jgi:hypothetical protein
MRWAGHLARIREEECMWNIGGKARGKRPVGSPRRRWVNYIKMDLREVVWGGVDWIYVAQDSDQCRAFINTVMKLRVPCEVLE